MQQQLMQQLGLAQNPGFPQGQPAVQQNPGQPPAHMPFDQGACGGAAAGLIAAGYGAPYPYGPFNSYTAGLFSPSQINAPGGIFVTEVRVGFVGMVDEAGEFYRISVTPATDIAPPAVVLIPLGDSLEIQVDIGYVQFFGAILSGADVALTAFSNSQSLPRILGTVSTSAWDTNGCFCPWDDCASATADSPIVIKAQVLPDCDDEPTTCDVGEEDSPETHFFRRIEVTLVGTWFRTIEGCTAVGAFAPLNIAAGAPVAPPVPFGCPPGLVPPGPGGMPAPGYNGGGYPGGMAGHMNGYNGQ